MTSYFRRRYGYGAGDFPVTDDVASRALTLPLYESITAEQQAEVLRVVNQGMDEL
jgi:dTDP-4-amino-4,6-dideoxygalactose transaminase